MTREKINEELIALIIDTMPEIADDTIDLNASITEVYGINSVSIIRIILAVEEKFEVSFSDYELDLSEYGSFSDLAAAVEKKLD